MPQTTHLPVAQGAATGWTLGAGASKPVAVQSDDGDTTYNLQTGTTPLAESYSVDALPGGVAAISQVDVHSKARRATGGTTFHRNEWNINGASTQVGTCTDPTAAYTLISSLNVARPGGGAFQITDFNGLTSGFQTGYGSCNTGTADETRCTRAHVVTTWTPAAGSYTWLLQCWLPPLIAVASHGLLRSELAKILRNLRTRPSSDEDFRRLLEAFRVRPRFA